VIAALAASAALLVACMVALWAWSVRLGDVSVVDVFWGPAFALVAWLSWALAPGPSGRGLLLCAMASAWGLRLGAYLAWRRRGQGEDRRYRAMRAAHGHRFPLLSLFTVFLLQALLAWTVSLPLQAGIRLGAARPFGSLDALGLTLFGVGLAFETAGDLQLARFLRDPAHAGQVMQRGLWRYTRHPNYFGDFLVWWGIGAVALAAGAWWSLAGPALMTVLLLRVSGVTLLERDIGERRPAYAAYAARTSAFFPWWPREGGRGAGRGAGARGDGGTRSGDGGIG
jgi:steroid 5-alpha reductase family enzyme